MQEIEEKSLNPLKEEDMLVEIRTDFSSTEMISTDLNYPISERDKLRCAVYKDLWEKGYYITSGFKFGCDYLVYPSRSSFR